MNFDVTFSPALPLWLIALVAAASGLLVIFGLAQQLRGSVIRTLAWAALTLALFNPVVLSEDREPLKSVVSVIVDESDSQKLDGRDAQTEATRAALVERLKRLDRFEVREQRVKSNASADSEASTALFSALKRSLQDVPPDRVAGAVLITDGQIHDVPNAAREMGFAAPLHALVTGDEKERDRRIVVERAPRFGIVGKPQELTFRVEDRNISDATDVEVRIFIDGELLTSEYVQPGRSETIVFDVPHGGKTILELEAQAVDDEITLVNNRAFAILDGIRENLRVLLVSGEPHAGERTWRNLLKSDAAVDLVHFTILRPPEKQDGTPINELSLIAFPTRELFIEKIDEFDLIIFDRYRRRGVLPVLYFDNIARYVREGGAILVASGPEYADQSSVYQTPLSPVLPASPDGSVREAGFRTKISEEGAKHPVTRDLPGGAAEPPRWSRWFRLIGADETRGNVVLEGPNQEPILVLDRPGDGRVAMLMSDHVWLWARGFEGGGPHVPLLRRVAHWLMKEPELNEESLRASSDGNRLKVERQSMEQDVGKAEVLTPAGERLTLDLVQAAPGLWRAEIEAPMLGLYQIANGEKSALAHVGPANPREYVDVTSTMDRVSALVEETRGHVRRLDKADPVSSLPRIVPIRPGANGTGRDWMGLQTTNASVLKGVTQIPLFGGLLGLALLLGAMSAAWVREGR
ncbi:MAG: hypothetical protein AAF468_06895 [Pseudomonadota bacterium]